MEKNCIWQESECRTQVMPEAHAGVLKGRLALAQLRGHPWKGEYAADTPWSFNDLDGRFGHTRGSSRGGCSNSEAVAIKVQAYGA